MEPTIKEPLLFFEIALTDDYIIRKWVEFKEDFSKDYGGFYEIMDNNLILNTEYLDSDEVIKKVDIVENFEIDFLKPILDSELRKIYLLIDTIKEEYINESNRKLLEIKLRVKIYDKLDALIETRKELIEKYPIFLNCFERINSYINHHCKRHIDKPFTLDKSPIENILKVESLSIIDKIFLPLRLAVEGKYIANTKEEVDYFIDCMKQFVGNKNFVPLNTKFEFKIKPESILKYIIGRYILKFKYQYTIDEVVSFVNKVISNFENKPQSLSKHYNDRPGNLDSYPFITNEFHEIE